MRKVNYYEYLASREWRLKRKQKIERAGRWCERCHERPIENVHHLTYERLGNERQDDLLGVCRACHEFLSAERYDDPSVKSMQVTFTRLSRRTSGTVPMSEDEDNVADLDSGLLCPHCGSKVSLFAAGTTMDTPRGFVRVEFGTDTAPPDQSNKIKDVGMAFSCDKGHRFGLRFITDKGKTRSIWNPTLVGGVEL